ncbi:MAG: arylesterase [Methylovulum sp.]|nr:arylesterase [Methylovulum sp.]
MINIFCAVVLMLVSSLAMAQPVSSIVILGDSISAAYGMETRQGWVSLLADLIKQQQLPISVSNESISGETSSGGLQRIDTILRSQKPAWVVLELGANDGLQGLSPALLKNNLTQIIQRSQQAGAKVMLLGMKIPPNYGQRYIDTFYNIYPELANTFALPWVPFLLADVALNKNLMQADGLHPNAQAQPIIAKQVASYLLPLLSAHSVKTANQNN